MAWTTPATWAVNEQVTAAKMNTQLRDNLVALKVPPTASYICNEAADYTTTSTSFVDVDGTNLALTITTTGGDVMVGLNATINTSGCRVSFDLLVDGAAHAGDDGMCGFYTSAEDHVVSFVRLLTGLAAGSHTIKLRWKVTSNSVTMYAGAGTSTRDYHPQFWIREVS